LRFIDVFNMKKPIFLQAAIVSLLVVAAGCMTTGARRGQAVTPADYDETIRVACVGDSITFGAGIKDRKNDNYPVVLGRSLGEMFEVRNFGVSGATLLKAGDFSYWKTPAFKAATSFDPHVVVIKLGTNDTKPQNWKHAVQYAADYEAMIAHFAALPAKPKIWLCSPAPVYQTRWGISEKSVVEGVIPKVQALARRKGLPVIDLYAVLSDKPEMFPDKIHPNAAGAKLMAEAVEAAILGK
jgi:acyl-CoA thioesterase-1